MITDVITIISCCLIGIAFLLFLYEAIRIWWYASKTIDGANNSDNVLVYLMNSKLVKVAAEYKETINININGKVKSNMPASEIFSEFTICRSFGINLRTIDAGAGTLVGLGLLGTFLGLTMGISGFDSSDSEGIQTSIQSLLDGMGTAFITSLLGMSLSIVYTIFEKIWRNGFAKRLYDLNQKLDNAYYIDDVKLSAYNQTLVSMNLTKTISSELQSVMNVLYERLRPLLQYHNADGREVAVSNAIREILMNNEAQTKALKSFSSDLALELNERFDETLSRQMQQRLIPLMESVDVTTKTVVEHIDQMALAVSSPFTDMMEHVLGDLKESLITILR